MRNRLKPYETELTYETELFKVRMVVPEDAADLLACYSDPLSAPLFNADNCTCDFVYTDEGELRELIEFWQKEYGWKNYVRFSLIDKSSNKAIGTIEMFAKNETFEGIGSVGLLRLDLASAYENEMFVGDLLTMIQDNFYEDFDVENIATKAVPAANVRIEVLESLGYAEVVDKSIVKGDEYYYICKEGASE